MNKKDQKTDKTLTTSDEELDLENVVLSIDQISQTIEVMDKVISRLKRQIHKQYPALLQSGSHSLNHTTARRTKRRVLH